MDIIKKQNGNVWILDSNGIIQKILPASAICELVNNDEICIKQGQGQFTTLYASKLNSYTIEPNAPVAWSLDATELIPILDNFFFDVTLGGSSLPIFLGEFLDQANGIPSELSYFYSTNRKEFYYSDLNRGKWLSFATITQTVGGAAAFLAGTFFRIEGVTMSPNVSGIYNVYPSTLVGLTFQRQNTTAGKIWVYEGTNPDELGGVGINFLLPVGTLNLKFDSLNKDFGSTIIVVRNALGAFGGNTVSQVTMTLSFKNQYPFIP